MKRTMLFILVGMIVLPLVAGGQEIYQWVDEKGTVHFTDDPGQIPERYRDQALKRETPQEPSPSTPIQFPVEPRPGIERKDLLGRGEDWWRTKALEWKQKLTQAQKDHEAAEAALKAKAKELEDARFKPKSFQRRLQDEVRVLEQKANEKKKQVDEAKNMLEKVLPGQAEEYRADPKWVRIE